MPETAAPTAPDQPAPPGEALVVGHFDEGPDYLVRRSRGAPGWLLTWTTAGAGRIRQGGVPVTAGPGELVVLGPDAGHEYGTDPAAGHWDFWWAHVPVRPAWLGWLEPFRVGARLYAVPAPPPGVAARVGAAFGRAHADARWSGATAPHGDLPESYRPAQPAVAVAAPGRDLATAGLEELLVLLTGTAGGRTDVDARIRRALALITADPGAPHTVASLARAVSLSPSRFAHLFRADVGYGPMQALREARLQHAAALLRATDLGVAAVAHTCGFASPYHFSRTFRDRFGRPPRSYRAGDPIDADPDPDRTDPGVPAG